MTDKEISKLVGRAGHAVDDLTFDVKELVEQAERIEYAVKNGVYPKEDALQIKELIELVFYLFDNIEDRYNVGRVIVGIKKEKRANDGRRVY